MDFTGLRELIPYINEDGDIKYFDKVNNTWYDNPLKTKFNLNFRTFVKNAAKVNKLPGEKNDCVFCLENDYTYIHNGEEWVCIGIFKGPQGIKGKDGNNANNVFKIVENDDFKKIFDLFKLNNDLKPGDVIFNKSTHVLTFINNEERYEDIGKLIPMDESKLFNKFKLSLVKDLVRVNDNLS